ncbi:MAG: type II secretion system protein M [Deltaproteobacteria bacterium]|nr:type II secretion system protein M [Deltaproteobacteria bacterium]MBW2447727.1 type II secretion system protein M [Deltaproteobacteria bacterium]
MSEVIARIRAYFEDLTPRERLALAAVGGALGLAIGWLGVVQPMQRAQVDAEARIEGAEHQIGLMQRQRAQYDEIAGRLQRVETRIARGPKGNIFTTLESLARNSAIKIESLEPQAAPAGDRYTEEKVQVVLKSVTLNQLSQYLNQIEGAPQLLSIKALRIRTRADKPELLDVTFTVSSFEPV